MLTPPPQAQFNKRPAYMHVLLTNYLRSEAEGEAGESSAREEGQPVLRPAPGRVEAPVQEHQRRAVAPSPSRGRSGRLLGDDLEVEAAGQSVGAAGLALLERVGARGSEGPGPPPPRHRRCRRCPRWHWRRHGEARKDEGGSRGGRGHGHGRCLVGIRCDAVRRASDVSCDCEPGTGAWSSDKMAKTRVSHDHRSRHKFVASHQNVLFLNIKFKPGVCSVFRWCREPQTKQE
jgi:hypothetical protein